MSDLEWLPPLVVLSAAEGDWNRYVDVVYGFFKTDFIVSSPTYDGRRCVCKRYPLIQGKEGTFWHLISEGGVEEDRLPDLRRCERIRWPRPMVERSPETGVISWRSARSGDKNRIVIALDDFSYIVVLADRGKYLLLWTAYCVEQEHRRTKLRREYERNSA